MDLQTTVAPAAVGVFAHLGFFIRGEWHLNGRAVLLTHIALGALAWSLVLRHKTTAISGQIQLFLLALGIYLLSLFSSIIIYRLCFHPLRHFPGPKLAAASKLWHVFKCRSGKNFRVLEDLHHKYGQYVRTGKLPKFHDHLPSHTQVLQVQAKSLYSTLEPSKFSKPRKAELHVRIGMMCYIHGHQQSLLATNRSTLHDVVSGVGRCQPSVSTTWL